MGVSATPGMHPMNIIDYHAVTRCNVCVSDPSSRLALRVAAVTSATENIIVVVCDYVTVELALASIVASLPINDDFGT